MLLFVGKGVEGAEVTFAGTGVGIRLKNGPDLVGGGVGLNGNTWVELDVGWLV